MKNVRFGIIGTGNMGTAHAACLYDKQIEGATLTALCDIRPERIEYCKQTYGDVRLFDDYKKLIDSGCVDAVIVATPHPLHAQIAIYALRSGLHVLSEKPIDISVTKARELNRVALSSGKVFGIMFNQRTNELFFRAREIVQSGYLGELKRSVWVITNWYRTQHYYDSGDWRATWAGEGGGVLLNQAPHNLDLWQWICGMPVSIRAVCDVAKYHNIEVEDDATIFARYKNGATGVFITSTGEFPGTNRLEISGDRGKLVIENGVLKWWKLSCPERKFCFECEQSFAEIPTEYTEIKSNSKESAHPGILRNFTRSILYGEPLLAPGTDGINELSISNAAYLSSWKGGAEIALPLDGEEFDRLLEERKKNAEYKDRNAAFSGSHEYSKRWQVNW